MIYSGRYKDLLYSAITKSGFNNYYFPICNLKVPTINLPAKQITHTVIRPLP